MKCSGKKEDGTPCDYTEEETFLFCPNCGSSCTAEESEPPVDVITCPGKNKQCGAQISSDSKANFCKECGWRIDRSLFCTPSKKCPGKNDDGSLCGGNITENDKFCLNCGQDFTSDENGDKLGSHLTSEHDTQANAGAKIDHCSKEGVENEALLGKNTTDTKPDTTTTEASEVGSEIQCGGNSTDTKPDTTITEVSEPGSGSLSGGSSTDTKPDTTITEVSEPGSGSLYGGSSTDTKPDTTITEVSEPGSGSLSGGSSTDTKTDTTITEVSEPGSGSLSGGSSTDTKPDTTTKHEVKTGSQTQLGISADIQQSQINSENGEDNALQSGQVSHDGHVMSNEKQSGEGCENEDHSDNDESGSEEESESSDESGDDEVKNDKSTDQTTTLSGDNAENQPSNSISNNPKQNQVSNESSMTVSSESEDTSSPKVKPLTLKQQSAVIEGNASPQETFDVSPKMGECQHQVPVALGAASETTAPITTRDISSKTEESSVNDDLTPAAVPSAISQGKENDNKDEEVSQKGKGKKGSKKKNTKKNKKKNVRGPKNKPTMTENESQTQVHHSQSKRKDDVDVIFHVIISSEFDFDPKSDKVSVAFQPVELGGFENGWIMKPVRCEDEIREYSCQVHMSKTLRNAGFNYKYGVTSPDKKVRWEKLYFHSSYTNRHFTMPGEMKQSKDSWHRYDGYVYPKISESRLQALFNFFKVFTHKFQEDVKVAARHFWPSHNIIMSSLAKTTPDESERAENLVKTVQDVLHGLNCQMPEKNRTSFKEEILMDYVTPLLNQLHVNSGMESHNKQGLLLGLFVVAIFRKNKLKLYLQKDHFKAMLVQPNREKQECVEMNHLEKHFPGKTESTDSGSCHLMQTRNNIPAHP